MTAHASNELNALVWCDHTDPALIQPFEEKHNVKVNLKEYEGTGAALAIVEQSQPGDWDVFVIDGVDVPNVVSSGLLAPLPQDQLPLDDVFKAVQMRDMTFVDGKMYAIMEKFGYMNTLEVPKIEKIIINMGVGEAVRDSKKIEHATRDLAAITGQKPVVTRAKRANAAFKLRAGMPIGCKVPLRRDRMYEFMDRLVTIALPRVRDFRGLNGKSFDGRGNYAMGGKERSCSRKSITTRWMRSAAWTS